MFSISSYVTFSITSSYRNAAGGSTNASSLVTSIRALAESNGFYMLATRHLTPFTTSQCRNVTFIMRPFFERYTDIPRLGVFEGVDDIYAMDERMVNIADDTYLDYYSEKAIISEMFVMNDDEYYYTVGNSKTIHYESNCRVIRDGSKVVEHIRDHPKNAKICGFCKN